MNIYGYARVSTQGQAEEGESIEIQIKKIQAAATLYCGGQAVNCVYQDLGVSGAKPLATRHEGAIMLGILRSGDVVIAAKLDRMFRSCVDAVQQLEDFKKRGIKLYLLDLGGEVTGDGISGLVFTILSAVAQFERERIAERITEAKAHCREKGMYAGGDIPFGYEKTIIEDDNSNWILIKDSKEQEIIAFIIEQRKTGGSLRAIALRVRDVYKVSMSHTLVKRILERESNMPPH